MLQRQPYSGTKRKLVLAFDIGTTFSAVSYSILDPGVIPTIQRVTRFPAQERVGGDAKIPTVIYYDRNGQARAFGAEAMHESLLDIIEDEGWTKAEWFKIHMRPKFLGEANVTEKIPPLPANKSIVDLFADFMRYLRQCAKTYILESHVTGEDIWRSVEDSIEYVLTHPNGWEGAQQSKMRMAAVAAGLVPGTDDGHSRIHFVTEGEASLHFCTQNVLTSGVFDSEKDGGVLIIDAGGGTVDFSVYEKSESSVASSPTFEEIVPAQCHFQGSVFVTRRAQAFLEEYLQGSRFLGDVPTMTEYFDKNTKLQFRSHTDPQYIKFGSMRDRDPSYNIRSGQIKLDGSDVVTFFQPAVSSIVKVSTELNNSSEKRIKHAFLVGGFAANEWLFRTLKDSLEISGIHVCRPDSHTNKAVPDGAISYYIDQLVISRVAKYSYGIRVNRLYDENDPAHRQRSHMTYTDVDGKTWVAGGFAVQLPKNTRVSKTEEFRKHLICIERCRDTLMNQVQTISYYRGSAKAVAWTDTEPDMFSDLCDIRADVSKICTKKALPASLNEKGERYFEISYDIVLSFGLTELKAQYAWKQNGVEKRGPVSIIYGDE